MVSLVRGRGQDDQLERSCGHDRVVARGFAMKAGNSGVGQGL